MAYSPSYFRRCVSLTAILTLLALSSGCLVPEGQLAQLRRDMRVVNEQNLALRTKLESLQAHARSTESKLLRTERNLAITEDQLGLHRRQVDGYEQEHELLRGELDGFLQTGSPLPIGYDPRLERLATQSEHLDFDRQLGVAKLKADLLFDTGDDMLKPGAPQLLDQLAMLLQKPDASGFRLMVVGHTDNQVLAGAEMRERFDGSNFRLATARAHAVRERLEQAGIASDRIGVQAFGGHQPIVSNSVSSERAKNRRVEIFVIAPSVPVVGWTETTPHLY